MRGRVLPTERDLQEARRLRQKAGSNEEYLRWGDSSQLPKRGKRGAPRKDFFKDFSVDNGPVKGTYLVRFRLDGAAPLACAFVRPKGVKLPKGMVEIKTPHQVFHEIAETLLKAEPARAGATIAGIVKKLDNELLKGVRALRRLEKNTRNI